MAILIEQLQLPDEHVLSAKEFTDIDVGEQVMEPMTDEEIVATVFDQELEETKQRDAITDQFMDIDNIEPPLVTCSQATKSLETAAHFFEQSPHATADDLNMLHELINRSLSIQPHSAIQSRITDFFRSSQQ